MSSPAPGVLVTIQPGQEAYPGVMVKPGEGPWNLAAFGHVEARVVNTGTGPLSLALRVDNAGRWQDNPWDTEAVTLAPGAADTLTTIFGYSYGRKPGYALKPSAVVDVLLFTGKSSQPQSFRIESLVAGGATGETPSTSSTTGPSPDVSPNSHMSGDDAPPERIPFAASLLAAPAPLRVQ